MCVCVWENSNTYTHNEAVLLNAEGTNREVCLLYAVATCKRAHSQHTEDAVCEMHRGGIHGVVYAKDNQQPRCTNVDATCT